MKWILLSILCFSLPVQAAKHPERWYQQQWCTSGIMEYVLPDRTRVDCLTETHAVEIDFAAKWYEGYTQARWYAANTGRRAALLLIIENETDRRHVKRAQRLREHYDDPIDIWIIRSAD